MNMRLFQCVLLALVSVTSVGCGRAAYEEQMNASKSQLGFATKFLLGLHPDATEVNDFVSIQLPKAIDEGATELKVGAKDRRDDLISDERLQPPFVKLPGYISCREHFQTINNQDHPVYCYFAVVPAGQAKTRAIEDGIKRAVAQSFPNAAWSSADLDRPDRTKISCRKLSVRGPQVFETSINGGSLAKLPGQFDLYLHSTPAVHVLIGFRTTDALAQKDDVFTNAGLSMGTLKVDPAGGGAPDA